MRIALVLLALAGPASSRAAWVEEPGVQRFLERYHREPTLGDRRVEEKDPSRLRVVDQFTYRDARPSPAPAGVELSILIDDRSPWATDASARAKLLDELGKTVAILGRCSVEVGAVHVAVVRLSDGLREDLRVENPYYPPAEVGVMTSIDDPVRPVALLLGDGYVHSFNKTSIDLLTRMHPESSALLDLSVVSWTIGSDYDSRFHVRPTFSLLAHELVHVLGDLDHVDTPQPNLMNGYQGPTPEDSGRAKSGDLFPWQCQAVRAYPCQSSAASRRNCSQ